VASYSVLIKRAAARELEALPEKPHRQLAAKIQALAANPRPTGCERLSGAELYRIRQGDYRVVYDIQDAVLTVLVVRVGHRREAHR